MRLQVHPRLDISDEPDPSSAAATIADCMAGKSGLLPVLVAEGCEDAVAAMAYRMRGAGKSSAILELRVRYRREVPNDEGPETALRGDLSHAAPETASGMAEAEIVDPGPGSGPTAPDSGLTPVLRFTMPADHRWHPGREYGVSVDGRLLYQEQDGEWRTSIYDDGDDDSEAGVVRAALRQAMQVLAELSHEDGRDYQALVRPGW